MKLPPLSLLTVLDSPIEFALNNTTYLKFMKFYIESFFIIISYDLRRFLTIS